MLYYTHPQEVTMRTQNQNTEKTYSTPLLVSHGDVVIATRGDNPITPPEAVDLQGFSEEI